MQNIFHDFIEPSMWCRVDRVYSKNRGHLGMYFDFDFLIIGNFFLGNLGLFIGQGVFTSINLFKG